MIDKILCISCEHQHYRRAAQITALQLGGYPLSQFEIVWGCHRHDYTDAELVDMFVAHGLGNYREVLTYPREHMMRTYSLSILESDVRALRQVVDEDLNAVVLHDDILLTLPYSEFVGEVSLLRQCVSDTPIFAQLLYNIDSLKPKRFTRFVKGHDKFVHGSIGNSTSAYFVNPAGAAKLLEALATLDVFTTFENFVHRYVYAQDWVYCVFHPHCFTTQSALQGDSVAMLFTEQSLDERMSVDAIEETRSLIEKFKLSPHAPDTREALRYGENDR